MPQQVILHIGPHKTGTTAIQKTLLANRALLAAAGWSYPEVGFSYYGHHLLPELLTRLIERVEESSERLVEAFDQIAACSDKVILSSENFSRLGISSVEALGALMRFPVVIVYYLRNFIDLIYAWWQEQIKHGYTEPFTRFFAEAFIAPFRFHLFAASTVLHHYAKVFGRESVFVYLYDPLVAGSGDVVPHFMETVLGLPRYQVDAGARAINKSFDYVAAEVIRQMNLLGKRGVSLVELPDVIRIRDALENCTPNFTKSIDIGYDQFALGHIEREFLASWADRIGNALADDSRLFEKRAASIRYLDPQVWIERQQLINDLRRAVS